VLSLTLYGRSRSEGKACRRATFAEFAFKSNADANNEHPMYVQQAGEVMIGSDHFNIDFQPSQHENDKKALWAQNIT
jgi:hypothetical protein